MSVVGECEEAAYRKELEDIAGGDPRVTFRFGRVPDEMLPAVFGDADVAMLGQDGDSVLTSGVFMLSLSMATPVLAPSTAMFQDFANVTYVTLYESDEELVGWLEKVSLSDVPAFHAAGQEAHAVMARDWRWDSSVQELRKWYDRHQVVRG